MQSTQRLLNLVNLFDIMRAPLQSYRWTTSRRTDAVVGWCGQWTWMTSPAITAEPDPTRSWTLSTRLSRGQGRSTWGKRESNWSAMFPSVEFVPFSPVDNPHLQAFVLCTMIRHLIQRRVVTLLFTLLILVYCYLLCYSLANEDWI